MIVCIPVSEDRGLDSPVNGHFGSAPAFLVVDTASGAWRAVANAHARHEHGACRPLDAIAGLGVEAMMVGGIGLGALQALEAAGIRVYRSAFPTARETLAAFTEGSLPAVGPRGCCGRHGQGGGCGHG